MVLLSSDYIWSIIFSFGHPSFRWLKEVQRLYKVRFKELGIFSLEKRKYSRRQSGCLKYLKACFWKMEVGVFCLTPRGRIRINGQKLYGDRFPSAQEKKNQGCLKVDWAVQVELMVSLLLEDLGICLAGIVYSGFMYLD